MNTKNIEVEIEVKNFEDLYHFAALQFDQFNKVEKRKDWVNSQSFYVDDPSDQMWFKQFVQMRFCEELAEAWEALNFEHDEEHFKEELTDATNFLLAAMIMVGREPSWLKTAYTSWVPSGDLENLQKIYQKDKSALSYIAAAQHLHSIHFKANWLCNLLKNRPWTQSHFPVSKQEFNSRLMDLWGCWMWTVQDFFGIKIEDIYKLFARKYSVNMFRIRSQY